MTNSELFLDYMNNFISVAGFANRYGYTMAQAIQVIDAGREEHEEHVRSIRK